MGITSSMILPSLSLKESILFSLTCASIVHAIYKKYEIQPSSYLLTSLLLIAPPTLSTAFYNQTLQSTSLSLLASFSTFYFSLASSIIAYRLSPFHPLYHYPGPTLAKITKLWMMRKASSGKMNEYVKSLHDRYGPYVRIGPNEISCIDPTVMHDLFGPTGMPKGPLWDARRNPDLTPPLIALRDLHVHARERKAWNRAFSTSSVKDYEPVIAKRVLQLANALERDSSSSTSNSAWDGERRVGETNIRRNVDLSEWFGYFAFDFMGDMAFGGGLELMRDGDKEKLWKLMESRVRDLAFLNHIPWAARLLLKFPSVTGGVNKFRNFTAGLARKRKELGSSASTKDLFYHLMDEDGVEERREPPSLESLLSNGEIAVVAGSDTTANTLSGVFYYLLTHPHELKRLREEVDRVFPTDEGRDAVDASRLASQMPVLNAVINETLRLQPAVMTYTQRAPAGGSGGHWLGKRFVTEGTAVIVPIYSIHRDPTNFSPFPDEFCPERWLHAGGDKSQNLEPKSPSYAIDSSLVKWHTNTVAFMPFSTGPANCAGKNLALAEMRAVVAVLVQRFDVAFAEDYNVDSFKENLEDRFITQVGKLMVRLSTRK